MVPALLRYHALLAAASPLLPPLEIEVAVATVKTALVNHTGKQVVARVPSAKFSVGHLSVLHSCVLYGARFVFKSTSMERHENHHYAIKS